LPFTWKHRCSSYILARNKHRFNAMESPTSKMIIANPQAARALI
jgi:hypothetical protein